MILLQYNDYYMHLYVQAIRVANQGVIDEWIEYIKVHPEDEWGDKLIDEVDWDSGMNPVHAAVMRNKVQILRKLIDAGAGTYMYYTCMYYLVATQLYTYTYSKATLINYCFWFSYL